MASAPAPRRSPRSRRPLPQPADSAMASASAPRRSGRARRPPPRLSGSTMASTSARRPTAKAGRPLPPPSDRAMAATSARRRATRGPAAHSFLPDEIWEDIFLRLDAAADLARASAACSSFHCIVSNRRFLRRFQSLRSPAVLGLISSNSSRPFFPVEPPHRSAPEARALELAADFTFSFLPDRSAWRFRCARDGRVLFSRCISNKIKFEDFLVCDPLHRRYVKIPRIPDDLLLLAAVTSYAWSLLPILAPSDENDEDSFRVIYTVHHKGKRKVMSFIFSSCNQAWRSIISTIDLPEGFIGSMPYYAYGCLYWMFFEKGYSLMLDTSEMKFSIIDLPRDNLFQTCAIVEAEEGRLGFLTSRYGTIDLYCKNWQSNGVGAQEWQHDRMVTLPKGFETNYHWRIAGAAGRYLALEAHHLIYDESPSNSEYFVLDSKTLLVEKLCTSNISVFNGFPYARFPPPLARPSI